MYSTAHNRLARVSGGETWSTRVHDVGAGGGGGGGGASRSRAAVLGAIAAWGSGASSGGTRARFLAVGLKKPCVLFTCELRFCVVNSMTVRLTRGFPCRRALGRLETGLVSARGATIRALGGGSGALTGRARMLRGAGIRAARGARRRGGGRGGGAAPVQEVLLIGLSALLSVPSSTALRPQPLRAPSS